MHAGERPFLLEAEALIKLLEGTRILDKEGQAAVHFCKGVIDSIYMAIYTVSRNRLCRGRVLYVEGGMGTSLAVQRLSGRNRVLHCLF